MGGPKNQGMLPRKTQDKVAQKKCSTTFLLVVLAKKPQKTLFCYFSLLGTRGTRKQKQKLSFFKSSINATVLAEWYNLPTSPWLLLSINGTLW